MVSDGTCGGEQPNPDVHRNFRWRMQMSVLGVERGSIDGEKRRVS
jgi:hypothetical protein